MEVEALANIVLLGILIVSTIVGFVKGFLRQAIELAGAIAAFILAILLSGAVAEWLEQQFQFPYSVALVVGFIALVLLGLFGSRFIATVVSKIVKMTVLNFVDRLAGGVLGLIFGMIICSLLITAALELPFDYDFRREVASSPNEPVLAADRGRGLQLGNVKSTGRHPVRRNLQARAIRLAHASSSTRLCLSRPFRLGKRVVCRLKEM